MAGMLISSSLLPLLPAAAARWVEKCLKSDSDSSPRSWKNWSSDRLRKAAGSDRR
jgi:hypothetical protein